MPRYFFHLADTSERILDPDGVEVDCEATAILAATQAVRELLDEGKGQASWNGWSLQVADEDGRILVSFDLDQLNVH